MVQINFKKQATLVENFEKTLNFPGVSVETPTFFKGSE